MSGITLVWRHHPHSRSRGRNLVSSLTRVAVACKAGKYSRAYALESAEHLAKTVSVLISYFGISAKIEVCWPKEPHFGQNALFWPKYPYFGD